MKKIQSQLVDNLHNTAKVMEAFANDYAKAKTKEEQEEILRFETLYLTDPKTAKIRQKFAMKYRVLRKMANS